MGASTSERRTANTARMYIAVFLINITKTRISCVCRRTLVFLIGSKSPEGFWKSLASQTRSNSFHQSVSSLFYIPCLYHRAHQRSCRQGSGEALRARFPPSASLAFRNLHFWGWSEERRLYLMFRAASLSSTSFSEEEPERRPGPSSTLSHSKGNFHEGFV